MHVLVVDITIIMEVQSAVVVTGLEKKSIGRPMSVWLNRKDVCQRCFSGIDDDQNGNCVICAKMDAEEAAWMKKVRIKMEIVEGDRRGNRSE